jgi:hypothetical protein
VGLLNGDGLIALGLPVRVEGFIEVVVQLTGRVLGHVEQCFGGDHWAGKNGAGKGSKGSKGKTAKRQNGKWTWCSS